MSIISREKISEFVKENFRIHQDWTGSYIEADPNKVGSELCELEELLDKFINN